MDLEAMVLSLAIILVVAAAVVPIFIRKRSKKRKLPVQFNEKWLEIQRLCASKNTWGQAIKEADSLLDLALKKRRFKGKSMGERIVAAQRSFSDNDSVWFAHNLAKKIIEHPRSVLRESETKKALIGIRQALRDLEFLNGN